MANIPAVPFVRGPNYFVPNMQYASDVEITGMTRADLGVFVAANATGILSAQSIATAGVTQVFAAAYNADVLGRYGRNITCVASGAATSTVTIRGIDYLGQAMMETMTLNGTTAVLGTKMFRQVYSVTWGATAATTINVGWGDRLGLPYRAIDTVLQQELVSAAIASPAGTLVAGLGVAVVASATTTDSRGYYTPNAANVPNGVRSYVLIHHVDNVAGMHGQKAFFA
jgi:hypothetical protein